MKNVKYLTLFILLLTTFSSCDSWLEVLPENKILRDEFWMAKEDVEGVLASTYDASRANVRSIIVHGELRAANLLSTGRDEKGSEFIDNFDILPGNPSVSWSGYYKAISLANSIIKMAPVAQENDPVFYENELNAYMAEAYFLRALNYFYIVRTWGEAPIITEPYETDEQEFSIAKSTETEVLNQIVSDLEIALKTAKISYDNIFEEAGRVTQDAVKALLADVYLWMDNYALAEKYALEVINKGNSKFLPPESWFNIFWPGNSNEAIFEFHFSSVYNQKGDLFKWFVESDYYIVSLNFDIEEMPVYHYEEDVRKYGSVYDGMVYKYGGYEPFDLDEDEIYVRPDNLRDANFCVYRISEMYLILAEAYTEQENFVGAKEALMKLRKARGVEAEIEIDPSIISYENFILEERVREFIGEGKEWFDLLRIGKRNDFARKELIINTALKNVSAKDLSLMKNKLSDPRSYYLPIYIEELRNNELLTQNPYYDAVTKI